MDEMLLYYASKGCIVEKLGNIMNDTNSIMNITISKSLDCEVRELTDISVSAFHSDVNVGLAEIGGPPDYDSVEWHEKMLEEGHLYSIYMNGTLVGGAILFSYKTVLYIGRIFLSPVYFRQGIGIAAMQKIENLFPNACSIKLDTPIANIRTNRFYRKLGYQEVKRDDEFVYYIKNRQI